MNRKELKPYPNLVCDDCGLKASMYKKAQISTYHIGKCEVCGKKKAVTEPRDYFHPSFKGHERYVFIDPIREKMNARD